MTGGAHRGRRRRLNRRALHARGERGELGPWLGHTWGGGELGRGGRRGRPRLGAGWAAARSRPKSGGGGNSLIYLFPLFSHYPFPSTKCILYGNQANTHKGN
jgi:hypothetical protein